MKEINRFRRMLANGKVIFADGGLGTQLQACGLMPGETPEDWNITRPNEIGEIHSSYVCAGADFVLANTFGASRAKYHGAYQLEKVIEAGVSLAKKFAGERLVALDVGPSGRLLKPSGDFEFDEAYESFAEQIRIGAAAGADLVVIETMGDTYELKAAVLAAKENCGLPVVATVALGTDGKLLTGGDVEAVAALLEGLRVDALGLNCGLGPDLMLPYVKRLAVATALPIMVKPNAGLPKVVDGKTVFLVGPEEFADSVTSLVDAGAMIVGGCCGTTPAHIEALKSRLGGRIVNRGALPEKTVVSSGTHAVEIPFNDSIIIGERINPTGKRKLKEAYINGDINYVLREALAQADAGAKVLDVNAGVPGIDEPAVLERTIQSIQSVCDLPLQIDTSDFTAMDRAMRRYNGKPLVNSVNGKLEVMEAVFPLVAKYGGVVVALTLDEGGIPATAEGRFAIARRMVEKGAEYGISRKDFVIDALCMTVSTDSNCVNVILETVKRVKNELGCRTALGVSNISFGLPSRPLLNASFYSLALEAGLSAAIVNPLSVEMMTSYRAWRALTGRDANCGEWIRAVEAGEVGGTAQSSLAAPAKIAASGAAELPLVDAIVRGLKDEASMLAAESLKSGTEPVEVINREIVPALEKVGRGFETGKVFLPQLLMAAEAASAAFEVIKAVLAAAGTGSEPKGPIIVATVKGDIHDIGKNIVRALLENYGFKVIDLGRDVPPEHIVEVALREQCRLVGLSALMTTTVGYMEETIRLLNAASPEIKTFVGGAVLSADYAAKINASWYAKDAMASVRIAESFFK